MYSYLWYFVIYAFLGWCLEVVYAAVSTGEFVNRGFLNGPICPIYGFGVLAVTGILTPVKENLLLLYFGSVFLTSVLEFITGWILEKSFNSRWWDYSDCPFNIRGYICLKFSLMWGTACLIIINIIHPMTERLVSHLNIDAGQIVLGILLAVIFVDVLATVQSVLKLNKQLRQINDMAAKIRSVSDELAERISEESLALVEISGELKTNFREQRDAVSDIIEEKLSLVGESIEEKISSVEDSIEGRKKAVAHKIEDMKSNILQMNEKKDEILASSFFGQKRLLHAFPDIKSRRYKEALEDLKEKILRK
ncbi:MAG: hypothetical protein AAGU76_06100 [Sedimentibacter sp.]|uniref:putative ABC transporter permease n=1 Tax=Sedimentibacter sp. TaxID=1960295 RepID=UPI003158D549